MSLFSLFNVPFKTPNGEESSYDLFLKCVDDLTRERLNSIEMVLGIHKEELLQQGFMLSELECVSKDIVLKRNQNGFYVDERNALNSKSEYQAYLNGEEFLNKNKERFKLIHNYLLEKEIIMEGSYKAVKCDAMKLDKLAKSMGYGIARDRMLFEEEPTHPSEEFKETKFLLDLCNNDDVVDYRGIINKALKFIEYHFSDEVSLSIKRIDDTYDADFDNTYGIMMIDKNFGEMSMLYYSDGLSVSKATYEKYIISDSPYLEIYMRIILKCLKKELENKKKGPKIA